MGDAAAHANTRPADGRAMIFPAPLLLAPMAGVADAEFRALCRMHGCRGAYTEMVSAKGLTLSAKGSAQLLRHEGGWLAVQLFGHEPEVVGQAARMVADMGFDALDLNMGCPVPKVVRAGEGSALMRTPHLAARLVRAAVGCGLPVTVKLRTGWDDTSRNFLQVANACVEEGAQAVCLHGRTRAQGYAGKADWQAIAELAVELDVPVLASGDVWAAQDVRDLLDLGCAAVMAARGALGNPWIFRDFEALQRGETPLPVTAAQRREAALWLVQAVQAAQGTGALPAVRKHAAWMIKGLPGAAATRQKLWRANSYQDFEVILCEWESSL